MANILTVTKGYPKEGALVHSYAPASGQTLTAGEIVKKSSTTEVTEATLANDEDIPVFVVLEGNDTWSSQESGKVAVLSGDLEFITTDYATGSYVVNAKLTADGGKIAIHSGTKKVIGYVMDFSLSQGVKVLFKG